MYNLPLYGFRMNALMQFSLLGDENLDERSPLIKILSGIGTQGKVTYESSGTNIPTTLSELAEATKLTEEDVGNYLLNAQLQMASSSLNYKTIFTKCYSIVYILNGKRDLTRDDIASRTLAYMLETYTKNINNSDLPIPFDNTSLFCIPNWVLNDIFMYFGRPYLKKTENAHKAFQEAFENQKKTFSINQDLVDNRKVEIIGPFSKLLYYSDKTDVLCCSVMQTGTPNILYRFIDIMALRDNILEKCEDGFDYTKVQVDCFEKGTENAKLYSYEEFAIPVPDIDKDITKPSRISFVYNCNSVKTAGEQDKNVKKMFYKLLVIKTFEESHTNLYDLVTSINEYYSNIVFDYRSGNNTSNSVTLLIDNNTAYPYTEEFKESVENRIRKILISDWTDEYSLQLNQIFSDLSHSVFRYYSKNSGSSDKILSDAAVHQLMPLAYTFIYAKQIDILLKEQGLSWRGLRKLYQELSNRGNILTMADTTLNNLYQQLQLKKKLPNGSEVVFMQEQPKLVPVFPISQIKEVKSLIYSIEYPLTVSTSVNTPETSEALNDIMFEKISEFIRKENNVSLQSIILSLKECITYLNLCIVMYEDAIGWSDDVNNRFSTLFALLFDRKVTELNDNLKRLKSATTLMFVTTTPITRFITVLFDTIIHNRMHKVSYALTESEIFEQEQETLEESLNQDFEDTLARNTEYIDILRLLQTIRGEISLPQYLLGTDLHYRVMGTGRLVVEPLGESIWGIRNCITGFTKVKYNGGANKWEIEEVYPNDFA